MNMENTNANFDPKSLIDQMVDDLEPVQSVASNGKRLGLIAAALAFGLTPIALFYPVRSDVMSVIQNLEFGVSLLLLFGLPIVSIWFALKSATPGQMGSANLKSWIVGFTYLLAIAIYAGKDAIFHIAYTPHWDIFCSSRIVACALIPYCIVAFGLTRLAPSEWLPTIVFGMTGAFAIGNIILQLYCVFDSPSHRILGHGIFVFGAFLLLLGPTIFVIKRVHRFRALKSTKIDIEVTKP